MNRTPKMPILKKVERALNICRGRLEITPEGHGYIYHDGLTIMVPEPLIRNNNLSDGQKISGKYVKDRSLKYPTLINIHTYCTTAWDIIEEIEQNPENPDLWVKLSQYYKKRSSKLAANGEFEQAAIFEREAKETLKEATDLRRQIKETKRKREKQPEQSSGRVYWRESEKQQMTEWVFQEWIKDPFESIITIVNKAQKNLPKNRRRDIKGIQSIKWLTVRLSKRIQKQTQKAEQTNDNANDNKLLTSKLNKQTEDLERLQTENAQLKKAVAAKSNQSLIELREQISKLTSQLNCKIRDLEQYESENKKLNDKISKLEQSLQYDQLSEDDQIETVQSILDKLGTDALLAEVGARMDHDIDEVFSVTRSLSERVSFLEEYQNTIGQETSSKVDALTEEVIRLRSMIDNQAPKFEFKTEQVKSKRQARICIVGMHERQKSRISNLFASRAKFTLVAAKDNPTVKDVPANTDYMLIVERLKSARSLVSQVRDKLSSSVKINICGDSVSAIKEKVNSFLGEFNG